MFTEALFIKFRTWKQPKYPSIEEWIKKMGYIYTIDYYSLIGESKIMPFAATRIDLEIVILSEVVRYRKTKIKYCLHMESKNGGCKRTYLQNRNRVTE